VAITTWWRLPGLGVYLGKKAVFVDTGVSLALTALPFKRK